MNKEKLLIGVGTACIAFIGYGIYEYRDLRHSFSLAQADNVELSSRLEEMTRENLGLLQDVEEQQAIIDSFQGQIQSITSTVGTLEKLSQTDPELLQKYSRVYFLNENYVPSKLEQIEKKYTFSGASGNFLFHGDAWPFLKKLLDAARTDGHELLIASAFRSFDTQASLKAGYTFTYGTGANQFSADQGYSEHQLGTSVDFTTPDAGAVFSKFETDKVYQWLLDNAYKYGFVISYPKGNTYYKFEPWHWRFVGVELATYLKTEGKYFYDLDQREIDKYLVKLFD